MKLNQAEYKNMKQVNKCWFGVTYMLIKDFMLAKNSGTSPDKLFLDKSLGL